MCLGVIMRLRRLREISKRLSHLHYTGLYCVDGGIVHK